MRKCRSTLIIAIQNLVEFKKNPEFFSEDRIKEIYIIISDNLSLDEKNKDQFSKYIIEAVNLMIQWLKPILLKSKIDSNKLNSIINKAKNYKIIIHKNI